MTAQDFPTILKQLRMQRGVSQRIVGDFCGLSQAEINRYELGKREPTIQSLTSIAAYFGVTVDELRGCQKGKRLKRYKKSQK